MKKLSPLEKLSEELRKINLGYVISNVRRETNSLSIGFAEKPENLERPRIIEETFRTHLLQAISRTGEFGNMIGSFNVSYLGTRVYVFIDQLQFSEVKNIMSLILNAYADYLQDTK